MCISSNRVYFGSLPAALNDGSVSYRLMFCLHKKTTTASHQTISASIKVLCPCTIDAVKSLYFCGF